MMAPGEVPSDGESVEFGVQEHEKTALAQVESENVVGWTEDVESGANNGDNKTTDQDGHEKSVTKGIPYCDHYSLQYPSSTVRFRSSQSAHRVYEGNRSQFVLEERDNQVVVKRVRDTTAGVYCLRACYTVVAIVWSGFLFIFCTQLLIFLVMDLASFLGATTGSELLIGRAIGTLLSFPLFVHGLASALIIDGHFVADTWRGGYLMKTLVFGGMASVLSAWISFSFYFGLPLLVMCICLLVGTTEWWKITALFWFSAVAVFYIAFVVVIIYFEIKACLEIVATEYDCKGDKRALFKKAILLRQTSMYSGYKQRVFIARGSLREKMVRESLVQDTDHYRQSLYSRFTKWPFLEKIGMYKRLPPPGELLHPVEEISGVRPFITHKTWSLEKLYCRPRKSWFVAVVKGPAALTRAQMRSSFVCSILGNVLTCLIIISFFIYFGAGALLIGVLVILMVICCVPSCRSTFRAYNMAKDVAGVNAPSSRHVETPEAGDAEDTVDEDDEEDDETADMETSAMGVTGTSESEGVFQVCVTYRTTKATERMCWTMFGLEISLLFIYPLVSLYLTGDIGVGTIFIVIGVFSMIRYYMNAGVVLEEIGNLKALDGKTEYKKWQNRSRTNDIVLNVTRSRTRGPWIIVLGFFFFLCLALVVAGMVESDPSQQASSVEATLIPGFRYERVPNSLPYPTCSLDFHASGFDNDGVIATPDFTFIAAMAYETNATRRQEYYDTWFGPGNAIDQTEIVTDFRVTTKRATSPVTYNLATFPNVTTEDRPFAVVSIRGSSTSWDWLTNAQLWSAALGMQLLQSFIPFGFVWRPIMDELVKAISIVESESLRKVSYYVETTDFVEWLQASGNYSDIKVTGHSLGGGLAIITSAQTGISGIAVSGPNAMLTRKAFNPPISEDTLNTFTFNVIPDRDVVPRVGGVAHLFENVECRAPSQEMFGCHTSFRTLCELLYKCGTGDRPLLCECVKFGYPEPISTSGESFAEACPME